MTWVLFPRGPESTGTRLSGTAWQGGRRPLQPFFPEANFRPSSARAPSEPRCRRRNYWDGSVVSLLASRAILLRVFHGYSMCELQYCVYAMPNASLHASSPTVRTHPHSLRLRGETAKGRPLVRYRVVGTVVAARHPHSPLLQSRIAGARLCMQPWPHMASTPQSPAPYGHRPRHVDFSALRASHTSSKRRLLLSQKTTAIAFSRGALPQRGLADLQQ